MNHPDTPLSGPAAGEPPIAPADDPSSSPARPALPAPSIDALHAAVETGADNAERLRFDFNRHALVQAMRALGLTAVAVRYSGGGDEGRIDDVGFEPEGLALGRHPVPAARLHYQWDETLRRGVNDLRVEPMPLDDLAENLCDAAIVLCGHDGFENGDGAAGTFTLRADTGAALLEHTRFFSDSYTSEVPL